MQTIFMMQEDPGAGATAQGAGQAGELPPLPMPGPGREDRHGAAPGAPAGDPGEVPRRQARSRRACLKVTRFSLIVPRTHTPGVLP